MQTHEFIIQFLADMKQLDMMIDTVLPAKMMRAQRTVQTALAGAGGVAAPKTQQAVTQMGRGFAVLNAQTQGWGKQVNWLNVGLAEMGRKGQEASADTSKGVKETTKNIFGQKEAMTTILGKFAQWTFASMIIFGIIKGIREMVQRSIELEKHFADLRRVMVAPEISGVERQIFGMAHAFGVATTTVIDATFEWGKTTRNITDIIYGQQAAILAVKVGEMELTESTRFLTAMYHSMRLRGNELIETVDKLNELQNRFGANIEGVMTVMARSGAFISGYGGDIDQLMGLTAAALKMTGELPSKVATLWRTLPRFMEQNQDELMQLGVTIRKSKGEYYSMEEQIYSLFGAYQKGDEATKRRIVALSAEGRSAMILRTLLENQDVAMAMVEQTTHAAGSAVIEYAQIMDTTAEKINRLNATVDRFSRQTGAARFLGGFIDSLDAILRAVSWVSEAFDGLGRSIDDIAKKRFKIPEPKYEEKFKETRAGIMGALTAGLGVLQMPGRVATVAQVRKYYTQQLKQLKTVGERAAVIEQMEQEMRRTVLGMELAPETMMGIAIQELVQNREELVRRTKEQSMQEIQYRAMAMEQENIMKEYYKKLTKGQEAESYSEAALIKEFAKRDPLVKKHAKQLLKQAELREKLAEGLSEEQKVEEEIRSIEMEEIQAQYNAGIISYTKYLEELQRVLRDTPKYTEAWYQRTQQINQLVEQNEQAAAQLRIAEAEQRGGALEKSVQTRIEAAKYYHRMVKQHGLKSTEALKAEEALYGAEESERESELRSVQALWDIKKANARSAIEEAEIDLQIAKETPAKGEIELREKEATIIRATKALAQARAQARQTVFDLRKSMAKSDLEEAEIELQAAHAEYQDATDDDARRKAQIRINEAVRSKRETTAATLDMLLDIEESTARTEQESINIAMRRAQMHYAHAVRWEDQQRAIAERNNAIRRQEELNKANLLALLDYEVAGYRDPIEKAKAQIQRLRKELTLTHEWREQLAIMDQIRQEQWTLENEIYNLRRAQAEQRIARMIEPLAREEALLALDRGEIERIRRTQGETAAVKAETAAYERARDLRMQRYEEEKRILELRRELQEITIEQEIQAIIKLAESVAMTREQTLTLRLELQRLQEEAEQEKREAFNLPAITLPTVYEIRRGLRGGYGAMGGNYIDNREISIVVTSDVDLRKVEEVLSRGTDRRIYVSGQARGLAERRY